MRGAVCQPHPYLHQTPGCCLTPTKAPEKQPCWYLLPPRCRSLARPGLRSSWTVPAASLLPACGAVTLLRARTAPSSGWSHQHARQHPIGTQGLGLALDVWVQPPGGAPSSMGATSGGQGDLHLEFSWSPQKTSQCQIFSAKLHVSLFQTWKGGKQRKAACTERSLNARNGHAAIVSAHGPDRRPDEFPLRQDQGQDQERARTHTAGRWRPPHQLAGLLLPPGGLPQPCPCRNLAFQPTGKVPNHPTPVETWSPSTPSANPHGTCSFPSPGVVEPEFPVGFVPRLVTEEASRPSQDEPGGATPGTERGHSPLSLGARLEATLNLSPRSPSVLTKPKSPGMTHVSGAWGQGRATPANCCSAHLDTTESPDHRGKGS